MQIYDKRLLRLQYRQARQSIVDRADKDSKIADRLRKHIDDKCSSIFVYYSRDNEVDTRRMIAYYNDSKRIYVPVVCGSHMHIVPYSEEVVSKTMQGICKKGAQCSACNIPSMSYCHACDICIVPLIAFDATRHRLGYGYGYYDRYLATTKTTAIGLAYDEQYCDSLIVEPHDIALGTIITPTTEY